jgi:PqqD family protein of HPr-rel-A system
MKELTVATELAISETGFLFLSSTGETFTVNEPGKSILRHLQQGMTAEQIAGLLTEEFDVDPADAARDVLDFVTTLKHLRLVREA